MRVHNFGAGPAALPLHVLERVREELLDFRGVGSSILEISHRSPAYSRVQGDTIERLRALLGTAGDHEILFMTGGARTQFSAVPMNLLEPGERADYVTTGRWSQLALASAGRFGRTREVWSGHRMDFVSVPSPGEIEFDGEASYVHYTSNNTIFGTQYSQPPDAGTTPLVCDMSSDFLSAPLDLAPFGVVYAGAQKNLGPAGVTLVLVRRDVLARAVDVPIDTLSYRLAAEKGSLLNTPPVFAIYVVGLVLAHLEERGGLLSVEERNRVKAELLYRTIDDSGGFYRGHARRDSRSRMNVTFRLPTPELEALFLESASGQGLAGLKGHRSVGGVRASIYNAIELEEVEALAGFMVEFERTRG